MSRIYSFVFPGTHEALLALLRQYPGPDANTFCPPSYLVQISGERLCFGIERCGHSGGYWFCPTVTEADGRLLLRGKLTSGCTPSPNKWYIQMFEALDSACMALLLAPFFLPVKLCRAIGNGIRRLRGLPPKREETTEDRLRTLMETLLGCTPT